MRTRPPASASRDRPAEEGARPALPGRREHPARDRAARGPRSDRRRARDRPRARRPHALPGPAGPARARGRDRPLARAAPPARRARAPPLRRRTRARPRRARSRSRQARLEPAVQRGHADRRREPHRPVVGPAVDGHGPARGRGPVLRAPGHEGVRRRVRGARACGRANRLPFRLARGFSPAAERRVGARRFPPTPAARRLRAREARRRGGVRTPPEDAPQLGRADRRRRARAGGGGAGDDRPAAFDTRGGARATGVRRARRGAALIDAVTGAATAKLNLALVVGPLRADGKHEVATVLHRIDLADQIAVERAQSLRVDGFPADTLVRAALEALAEAAGVQPAWHARIMKTIPVAAGLGGGSSDAAAALRLANQTLDKPLGEARLHELAARLGADVPFFLTDRPQLGEGDGSKLTPLDLPQDYSALVLLPHGAEKASTAAVYADFDARGGADGWPTRRVALTDALAAIRRPRDLASLPPNDLASSPFADELLALGAFRADVTGAGPAVYGLFDDHPAAAAAERVLATHGRLWIAVPCCYR